MALPNIYLWMGERGWTHVYPDEIRAPQFQHGISANDRLLLCRTCGQHVGYVAEFYRIDGARVSSFFRHAPGTVCDDIHYTHEPTPPPPPAPNPEAQDIPVYLSKSGELFNWEVKLPQPSEDNASWTVNSLFEISFDEPISERYRFRFSRSGGVRFAIGANPPETCRYSIRKQSATGWTDAFLAPKSWRIEGGQGCVRLFQEGGWAAFSDETGRLLPVGADIGVGKWVRIATKANFVSGAVVETIKLAQKGAWKVYRARAKNCTRNAADWFLKYGLNLTAAPTLFLPVWPPSVSTRTLRIHKNPRMFFFLRGVQSAVRLWPSVGWSSPSEQGSLKGNATETLVSVRTDRTFCTLVADRWGTLLQSEFLWKRNPLSFQRKKDDVAVEDETTHETVPDGAQLPPKPHSFRLASPEYDGYVAIQKETNRREVLAFKVGEAVAFSVDPGDMVSVCFARDPVWRVSVGKPEPALQRPQSLPRAASRVRVPFSHAMAGVLCRLPDAGIWKPRIRTAVRQGWMNADEYAKLKLEASKVKGDP